MNNFLKYYRAIWGFHNSYFIEYYAKSFLRPVVSNCREHRVFNLLKYRKCVVCGLEVEYENKDGKLVLLGTEIGNAFDVTPRVLDALKNADYILCEHEDSFEGFLNTFKFKPKGIIFGYSEFDNNENGNKKRIWLYEEILSGKDAVMIADQGMPFVMDPCDDIFKDAINYGVKTTIFPGPDAPVTALNISGLNAWDFTFIGFLPHQTKDKEDLLRLIKYDDKTNIFFDKDIYILETLKQLSEILGENKNIALCFNITRETENIIRGTVKEVIDWLLKNGYDQPREDAEWLVQLTVVVEGNNPKGPHI